MQNKQDMPCEKLDRKEDAILTDVELFQYLIGNDGKGIDIRRRI